MNVAVGVGVGFRAAVVSDDAPAALGETNEKVEDTNSIGWLLERTNATKSGSVSGAPDVRVALTATVH